MAVQHSGTSTAYLDRREHVAVLLLAIILLCPQVGCSAFNSIGSNSLSSIQLASFPVDIPLGPCTTHLMRAEQEYVLASGAQELESEQCVDHFYQTAKHAWLELNEQIHENPGCSGRAYELYNAAMCCLVKQATKYERLHPQQGLRVKDGPREVLVPVAYCGFVRTAEDFSEVECVEEYSSSKLHHVYRMAGIGTPVIVKRCKVNNNDFRRDRSLFAATVLLRNDTSIEGDNRFVIEFCDPLRVETTDIQDVAVPIMRDLSAPFAKALQTRDRQYLASFLRPGQTKPDEVGLFMIEPYQKGKIPVVFIHGLLSDRLTWASMMNEMSGRPDLLAKFQPWSFEYPTGEPFLKSAADLRKQFCELLSRIDPETSDPMLQQIVLVGHSMGGLISTAQTTASEDYLWSSIANQPFENVLISPRYRDRLHSAFFFEPSPAISRVVYIGTPHRGSSVARRAIGKIGSLLIQETPSQTEAHQKLIAANPGVFKDEFRNRLPTSVDLLSPDSKLLQALRTLPRNPGVIVHSIIGDCCWTIHDGPSDEVVAVNSARTYNAASESIVDAKHTELTQDAYVIKDVFEILSQHYESVMQSAAYRAASHWTLD